MIHIANTPPEEDPQEQSEDAVCTFQLKPPLTTDQSLHLESVEWIAQLELEPQVPHRDLKGELVRMLREAGDYSGRLQMNNEFVALMYGEVEDASKEDMTLAVKLSLLWGICNGAYLADHPQEVERIQREFPA